MRIRHAICYFGTLLTMLSAAASSAWARLEVEALAGEPFGVANVSFSLEDAPGIVDMDRIRVTDDAGRAVYPSAVPGLLGKLLGAILNDGGDMPAGRIHVAFLFRGTEPFNITLHAPVPIEVRITPRVVNARQLGRALEDWSRDYQKSLANQTRDGDFPPQVQTYLTTMLSKRLGLTPPPAPVPKTVMPTSETERTLELMMGLEKFHNQMMYDAMLNPAAGNVVADQPLPPAFVWPNGRLPAAAANVPPVEPIAAHVPAECFYIRFGRFNNYLWFDDLQDDYGGDLESMVTLRAFEIPMSERGEKQLGLEKNALADLFGEAAISDVALIGRDTFLEEGGALGILFEGRNDLIDNDLRQQQKRALKAFEGRGATLVKVQIAGHEVDFLSTPDNRLRSFHAADGLYHLVTTSQAMVERFYAAGAGERNLAQSPEFQMARSKYSLERKDTVFAFFSPQFFEGLLTPQYQVELHRRMRSIIDMELLQLAQLAARNERLPEDVPSLIAAGFLPRDFGQRVDGSSLLMTEQGLVDSKRGPRGHFLPITDVKIDGITVEEARRCQSQLQSLSTNWGSMDPLVVALKRFSLNNQGLERLVIDASISPLDETKYGWVLSMLGPPTKLMAQPLPDDIISAQAALSGGTMFKTVPPHIMFLGIKDLPSLSDPRPEGLLGTLQTIRSTPGYLGAWPKAGFVDMLPFGLAGQPDQFGFSFLPFGLMRWQGAGFSILSFDQPILSQAASQIQMVEGEIPAQIRIHAGNLAESKIAPALNTMSLDRSIAASKGNTRLMHTLTQQLGVPADHAKGTLETLLDARLVCPLGGEYAVAERDGDQGWISTKWPAPGTPADAYQAPILAWFRGLDVYVVKTEAGIDAHAELDLQRKPTEAKFEIPPLFGLNNLFGGGQPAVKPAEPAAKPQPEKQPPAPQPDVKPADPAPPVAAPVNPPAVRPAAVTPPAAVDPNETRSILKKRAAEPAPFDELPAPNAPPKKQSREF